MSKAEVCLIILGSLGVFFIALGLLVNFSDGTSKISNKCINGVFEDNVRITKFSIFLTIFNLIILIISIIK
jgi:hypothetical protein